MSIKKIALAMGGVVLIALCVVFIWPRPSSARALDACEQATDQKVQVECIFRVIESEFDRGGLQDAMKVFAQAYDQYYSFASTGCHRYAHRVGDIAYYREYLVEQDFDAMDFPQETTACGYGFYHGFFEHLIQDHATSEFISDTCSYFKQRLSANLSDIGTTCYHGSGHGLSLAQGERTPKGLWGNIHAFADAPLAACAAMPHTTDLEQRDCKEGVFNVIVEWMAQKQYGLDYDLESPFRPCHEFKGEDLGACYAEMSQKLVTFANSKPARMAELLQNAPDSVRMRAFGTGIAGIIQQTIANEDPYRSTLIECATLSDELFNRCVGSTVNGLFEHGMPQEEYVLPLTVCTQAQVIDRGLQPMCYDLIAQRLSRFYEPARVRELCARIPEAYRTSCTH